MKKVQTCLELITDELKLLERSGKPCKAFRYAPRSPTGVYWKRNGGFKYLAELQPQEMSAECYQQLNKEYPAYDYKRTVTTCYTRTTLAGSRHRVKIDLLEQCDGVSPMVGVVWGANWFRSDQLELDEVLSVLRWLSLQPALSVEPKDDFLWRSDVGFISVDGRTRCHLCANSNCYPCLQARSGNMEISS
jgi:hypothetical protein